MSAPALDPGAVDLFRKGVKEHAESLRAGLAALKEQPADRALALSLVGPARDLQDAARGVGMAAMEKLGLAYQAVLAAAGAGQAPLGAETAETLLRGVRLLQGLNRLPPSETQNWMDARGAQLLATAAQIQALAPGVPSAPPAPPAAATAAPAEAQEPGVDYSMLDIFKQEAEGQTAALNAGLLALEAHPDSKVSYEALMRAAHSIKGAARIVGLTIAVELAHALEDQFVAAQEGRLRLDSARIDTLLAGADLLVKMAQTAAGELPAWLKAHGEEIRAMARRISSDAGAGSALKAAPAPSAPRAKAGPAAPPAPAADPEMDLSMLEIFRTEVEGQAGALNAALLELEANPKATGSLESMMRAAHSMKGAARIVGLGVAVHLAHAMEDLFVAAREGRLTLDAAKVDLLLAGSDFFVRMAEQEAPAMGAWLDVHRAEIETFAARVTALAAGAPPAAPPPAPPPAPANRAPESAPAPASAGGQAGAAGPAASASGLFAANVHTGSPPKKGRQTVVMSTKEPTLNTGRLLAPTRVVKVSAQSLDRVLGLAGEALVQTGWQTRFTQTLGQMKRRNERLNVALHRLRDALAGLGLERETDRPVSEAEARSAECYKLLVEALNDFERLSHTGKNLSERLYHEAVASRMRPFDDVTQGFPRLVRDVARQLGKQTTLVIEGRATEVDRDILEKLEAPLNHLIRNSLDHGLEAPAEREAAGKPPLGTIRLEARHRAGMLFVAVADDGRGIDLERVRRKVLERKMATPEMVAQMKDGELLEFLFLPGFSTAEQVTEISGRGVGLDVVHSMVQACGGTARITTKLGRGTAFHLQLPITLSVIRTLLVEIKGEAYAFPLSRIERLLSVTPALVLSVEGKQCIPVEGENVGLIGAWQVLELEESQPQGEILPTVVLNDRNNRYGLVVDRFLGEAELAVRPLDVRLGKVPGIAAAAILQDGAPVLIVDPEDLVRLTDHLLDEKRLQRVGVGGTVRLKRRKRVLVVDDSFTVRETERKLLERKGYEVVTSVDGLDGWHAATTGMFDLIVSDVDMPRMNGIELVRNIKKHERIKSVPVIIVSYKDRAHERQLGLEAGANYYLTKGSFQDQTFVQAVVDLIGEGTP